MRRLIRELPYERVIASGKYVYAEDGGATGAVEEWQLSEAREGYRFLRVDLNAAASSGDNVLYHLVLDATDRPERLKFRFFRDDAQVRGDLLFSEEMAWLTRDVDGERQETDAPFPERVSFWFPACAGLSLLAGETSGAALTLKRVEAFELWPTQVALSEGPAQTLTVMGGQIVTRRVTVRWEDEERVVWLDEHDWPVQVQRGALTAVETRYIRYR